MEWYATLHYATLRHATPHYVTLRQNRLISLFSVRYRVTRRGSGANPVVKKGVPYDAVVTLRRNLIRI